MSLYYVNTGEDVNGNGTWDVYAATDGTEINSAAVAAASRTDPATAQARLDYQAAVKAQPYDAVAVQTAAVNYANIAGAAVVAAASVPYDATTNTGAGASAEQIAKIAAVFDASQAVELQDKTPEQIDALIGAAVTVPGRRPAEASAAGSVSGALVVEGAGRATVGGIRVSASATDAGRVSRRPRSSQAVSSSAARPRPPSR